MLQYSLRRFIKVEGLRESGLKGIDGWNMKYTEKSKMRKISIKL